VACGGLIGVVSQTVKLWDFAAGALIAEAAGAIVTDHQGRKLFPTDVAAYAGSKFQILAANKKTHAELLSLLQS
jgi:fructose-1,6-bisphosphatase/inositol monophosphatase family enzyme